MGTMEKLGIGYDTLKGIRPDLIMVSMPGWGSDGPYKGYVSLGSSLDGFTGHHILRGYPDTDASYTGVVQHPDAIGAVTLPFSVLVALHNRNRTGEGQWIDISPGGVLHTPPQQVLHGLRDERPRPAAPGQPRLLHGAPRLLPVPGEDSWVVITVSSDLEWEGLCRTMGDPQWSLEEKYADPLSRHRYQDDLDGHIQEWTLSRDKMEIMHLLQEAGVPAQAVMDDVDIYSDPHLEARGFFERVSHPVIGEFRYPGHLWKLSKVEQGFRIPPAGLGEHNEYVYGTLLGMSAGEIQDMADQGIIGDELPLP